MGNWDDALRLQLIALVQALECPKCHEVNSPGHASIEYDEHLRAANCSRCGHAWCVRPAAV